MDNYTKDQLETEIMISTLGGVGYCELMVDGVQTRVVIVGGLPVEFRVFCMLCMFHVTGGVYAYYEQMNVDILAFWKKINFEVKPTQPTPKADDLWGTFLLIANQRTDAVNSAIKALVGDSSNELADLRPILEEVSQRAIGDIEARDRSN